jgi:hypothetical protein
MPVNSDTAGAVKCLRGFKQAQDMYELSQVFLGAQYFAALDKSAGVSKSVTAGFSSLSAEKAKELPMPEENPKVAEARKAGTLVVEDDGTLSWTDANKIAWTFDPSDDSDPLCVGRSDEDSDEAKSNDEDGEEVDDDGGHEDSDGQLDSGSEGDSEEGSSDEDAGSSSEGSGDPEGGEPDGDPAVEGESESGSSEALSVEDADEDEEDSESEGDDVVTSDADDEDDAEEDEDTDTDDDASDGTDDKSVNGVVNVKSVLVLFSSLDKQSLEGKSPKEILRTLALHTEGLEKDAAAGREYVQQLRADALAWYVKASMVPGSRGVKTAGFEKMLDRIDGDMDLLKEVIEEQKELAQKRWPVVQSVRRSSVSRGDDLNDGQELEEIEDTYVSDSSSDKVSRLHG